MAGEEQAHAADAALRVVGPYGRRRSIRLSISSHPLTQVGSYRFNQRRRQAGLAGRTILLTLRSKSCSRLAGVVGGARLPYPLCIDNRTGTEFIGTLSDRSAALTLLHRTVTILTCARSKQC